MATRDQMLNPGTTARATTHEPAITQVLTRAYALNWEVIAYTIILVFALVTRFADLGARVMSHDESLHTYYSWRLYEFGEFSHTPLMHGPLLFHMTALSYFLFGDSDFTARIYPALLGVLIVMFPLLFRRWLGRIGAVLAAVGLLISPQLMYYSRYIRHDIPLIFFALLMLYAMLEYIDGKVPRRPVWLGVLAVALVGMLASKEVAFIYIAIFGSYMTLLLLMRYMQEIGIARRPERTLIWRAPWLQLAVGHLILLVLVGVFAMTFGRFAHFLWNTRSWTPTSTPFVLLLFVLTYLPLAFLGLLRSQLAGGAPRDGAAAAIMQGLGEGQSALRVITAGLIIGVLIALLIVCVIDVIKPETTASDPNPGIRTYQTRLSENDLTRGQNFTKEVTTEYAFDAPSFFRVLTWVGLPVLLLVFVVFLAAVFAYPGHVPLPWREMLLILLLAVLVASLLVMFERRTFLAHEDTQPFAADPNAATTDGGDGYNNNWIIGVWVAGLAISGVVLATRFFTNWWDFLNRQPIFDVCIIIGTLILPWLAAYPIWLAGYNLEEYNRHSIEGRDTLRAALWGVIPFFMITASVGLSWNWKRWLASTGVFLALFVFFFTTVFSVPDGLVTGMIGSLGYWLEQQGVRRGSQPQYYYMLTQLPVYEYLFMLGAMGAGVSGLNRLWRWRRDRYLMDREQARLATQEVDAVNPVADLSGPAQKALRRAWPDDRSAWEDAGVLTEIEEPALSAESGVTLAAQSRRTLIQKPGDEATSMNVGQQAQVAELPDESAEDEEWAEWPGLSRSIVLPLPPALTVPFSMQQEAEQRRAKPEWIGAFPLLMMVGWWAVAILFGLTIAGEKMPWLTTHLTVPLILLTGWWLDRIGREIAWARLREGGWLVLIGAMPLAFLALAHVVTSISGTEGPFRGREIGQLLESGNWLFALLIFLGALYVIGRFGQRLGVMQLGRMAIVSSAVVLALLTARTAYLASFVNYDYATEYLVYAHAGPAVKTVLDEINHIAEITNEGENMRIVFDDESSWPYTWYFRDYPNYGFLRGEAGSVDPSSLDGARVVVVGNKKVGDVRQILGDRYYEAGYIRLWWPMQEYFNLTQSRVANVFSLDADNIASDYYRQGLWDIWLNRDYTTYAQAMCIDSKQDRCATEAEWGTTDDERDAYRLSCQRAVVSECANDSRFAVNNWPVSDRMYFFVDKTLAAQVWDAGIGSSTVDIREPEYPEDLVYSDVVAENILTVDEGLVAPRGIAVTDGGDLVIADTSRNRVVVLGPDGLPSVSIGGALSSDPNLLQEPWGVAVGPDGNIYVADTWHNRVAVFSLEGELLRAWGHEGVPQADASPDAMWGPRDIKIGPDDLVYVADTGGKRIRVYTLEGEWMRDIGTGGSQLGQLDEPVGLAFNPVSGELYVAESWNRRIQVFDPTNGVALRAWTVNMWYTNRKSVNRPYLAVSPDGSLVYATDMDDHHRIVAYNLQGVAVLSFNQPDNLEQNVLGMRSPAGLAFDAQGRLYAADAELNKIFVFPPSPISGSVLPQSNVPAGVDVVDPNAQGALDPEDTNLFPEEIVEQASADAVAAVPEDVWQPLPSVINDLPMVYVPAGCFTLGEHGVTVDDPAPETCLSSYWIGQTEVTYAQYAACVAAEACTPPEDSTYFDDPAFADAPVVGVSWAQAQEFATWAGGSLPTEAQWEYAARGASGYPYPWGEDTPLCGLANTSGCGGLIPVGVTQRVPGQSWVGALDLAGSVAEWTVDWWSEPEQLAVLVAEQLDAVGPDEGLMRVARGGSWMDDANSVRVTSRVARLPEDGYPNVGIRVVMPPAPMDRGAESETSGDTSGD